MKEYFVYFLIGIVIGFLINKMFVQNSSDSSLSSAQQYLNEIESANEFEEMKNIRILCLLNTYPANHYKAIHVQQTWGKHCDKLLFASSITDVNINAIGLNISDGHGYVWGKEKLMLQYVYKNFLHQYDWFFKGDDDTFANIENMRFMLSAYSTDDPIYFGHKFNTSYHRWGYFSGGAGRFILFSLDDNSQSINNL